VWSIPSGRYGGLDDIGTARAGAAGGRRRATTNRPAAKSAGVPRRQAALLRPTRMPVRGLWRGGTWPAPVIPASAQPLPRPRLAQAFEETGHEPADPRARQEEGWQFAVTTVGRVGRQSPGRNRGGGCEYYGRWIEDAVGGGRHWWLATSNYDVRST
jgi:hypothetical protein